MVATQTIRQHAATALCISGTHRVCQVSDRLSENCNCNCHDQLTLRADKASDAAVTLAYEFWESQAVRLLANSEIEDAFRALLATYDAPTPDDDQVLAYINTIRDLCIPGTPWERSLFYQTLGENTLKVAQRDRLVDVLTDEGYDWNASYSDPDHPDHR